jgi:hypothetical protein
LAASHLIRSLRYPVRNRIHALAGGSARYQQTHKNQCTRVREQPLGAFHRGYLVVLTLIAFSQAHGFGGSPSLTRGHLETRQNALGRHRHRKRRRCHERTNHTRWFNGREVLVNRHFRRTG